MIVQNTARSSWTKARFDELRKVPFKFNVRVLNSAQNVLGGFELSDSCSTCSKTVCWDVVAWEPLRWGDIVEFVSIRESNVNIISRESLTRHGTIGATMEILNATMTWAKYLFYARRNTTEV